MATGRTPGPDLRGTVDHLWSFLDDLAESDPDGYRRFIESQIGKDRVPATKAPPKDAAKPPGGVVLPFQSALNEGRPAAADPDEIAAGHKLRTEAGPATTTKRPLVEEVVDVVEAPKFTVRRVASNVVVEVDLPRLVRSLPSCSAARD